MARRATTPEVVVGCCWLLLVVVVVVVVVVVAVLLFFEIVVTFNVFLLIRSFFSKKCLRLLPTEDVPVDVDGHGTHAHTQEEERRRWRRRGGRPRRGETEPISETVKMALAEGIDQWRDGERADRRRLVQINPFHRP